MLGYTFGSLRGLSILVVEDEADARELVADLIQGCGGNVYLASGVSSALEVLASHTPDVMISDIAMADEDGYSLMRQVRALCHRGKRTMPAIALTAYTRDRDRSNALGAGFDEHMTKPLNPAALVRKIIELYQGRRKP